MTTADDAAEVICQKLEAAGIRATTDPGALNPPAVLVPANPRRTYDVGCGYSATWSLRAVAPAPTGGDHVAWALLNELADAVAEVCPVESMIPYGYPVGRQVLPSYLITFVEAI